MYFLDTTLDSRDAFVVAVREAFDEAGLELMDLRPGQRAEEPAIIRLELQVDGVTIAASVPTLYPVGRQEFLEENPDMLRIALRDILRRHFKPPR